MNLIYSSDGSSIFDVALTFERLGIQQMNKYSEFSTQVEAKFYKAKSRRKSGKSNFGRPYLGRVADTQAEK